MAGIPIHYTAPVNTLYALHEALLMVHEEGIENAWQRHRRKHQPANGLEQLGMRLLARKVESFTQLNTVIISGGMDDAKSRQYFLHSHGLEIGAGLGALAGKIWRIGLMGQASRAEYVE